MFYVLRRIISAILVVTCLISFSELSLAGEVLSNKNSCLAPTSRFKPIVNIVKKGDNSYEIRENKDGIANLSGGLAARFKSDVGFLYITQLIGDAFQLGLEGEDSLKALIKTHLAQADQSIRPQHIGNFVEPANTRSGGSFNLDDLDLRLEGDSYYLGYRNRITGKMMNLRYFALKLGPDEKFLPNANPVHKLEDGRFVMMEVLDKAGGARAEPAEVMPAQNTVPAMQEPKPGEQDMAAKQDKLPAQSSPSRRDRIDPEKVKPIEESPGVRHDSTKISPIQIMLGASSLVAFAIFASDKWPSFLTVIFVPVAIVIFFAAIVYILPNPFQAETKDKSVAVPTMSGHDIALANILEVEKRHAVPKEAKPTRRTSSVVDVGGYKQMLFSVEPSVIGASGAQALSLRDEMRKALGEKGIGLENVVKIDIYLKEPKHRELCEKILEPYFGRGPPISYVNQPPANGDFFQAEVVAVTPDSKVHRINEYVTVVENNGLFWAHVAGIEPDEGITGTYEQAYNCFEKMRRLIEDIKIKDRPDIKFEFEDIVRTWLYEERIVDSEGEKNRYNRLNKARKDFFANGRDGAPFKFGRRFAVKGLDGKPVGPGFVLYPSSTGIGMSRSRFTMEALALSTTRKDVSITQLPNPDQTEAFDYGTNTERDPPLFSRGMAVSINGDNLVIVSGTASIIGEKSVHIGDAAAQTHTTIDNINKVISQAGAALADVSQIRVYVKPPDSYRKLQEHLESKTSEKGEDLDKLYEQAYGDLTKNYGQIREVVEARLGGIPCLYLIADVCRPELLVEIEAVVAVKKEPEPATAVVKKPAEQDMAVSEAEAAFEKGKIEVLNKDLNIDLKYASFDFDGTLADTMERWRDLNCDFFSAVFLESGAANDKKEADRFGREFYDETIGMKQDECMEKFVHRVEEKGGRAGTAEDYEERRRAIINAAVENWQGPSPLIAGITDLLDILGSSGIGYGMATGASPDMKVNQARVFGLGKYFNSDKRNISGSPVPKSQILLEKKRELRLSSNEIIHFGDNPIDIQEGKRAGCVTIAIARDAAAREELLKENPDIIIHGDYRRLEALLQALNLQIGQAQMRDLKIGQIARTAAAMIRIEMRRQAIGGDQINDFVIPVWLISEDPDHHTVIIDGDKTKLKLANVTPETDIEGRVAEFIRAEFAKHGDGRVTSYLFTEFTMTRVEGRPVAWDTALFIRGSGFTRQLGLPKPGEQDMAGEAAIPGPGAQQDKEDLAEIFNELRRGLKIARDSEHEEEIDKICGELAAVSAKIIERVREYYNSAEIAEGYQALQQQTPQSWWRDPKSFTMQNLNEFVAMLKTRRAERVADVGTGGGWDTEFLRTQGFDAVGIDVSAAEINKARERYPLSRYEVAYAQDLSNVFNDDSLDGAWAQASFYHIPYYGEGSPLDNSVREISKKLRRGGLLYMGVHSAPHGEEGALELESRGIGLGTRFSQNLTEEEVEEVLLRNGFRIIKLVNAPQGKRQRHWITVFAEKINTGEATVAVPDADFRKGDDVKPGEQDMAKRNVRFERSPYPRSSPLGLFGILVQHKEGMTRVEIEKALELSRETLNDNIRAFVLHLPKVIEDFRKGDATAYRLTPPARASADLIIAILSKIQESSVRHTRPYVSYLEEAKPRIQSALEEGSRRIARKEDGLASDRAKMMIARMIFLPGPPRDSQLGLFPGAKPAEQDMAAATPAGSSAEGFYIYEPIVPRMGNEKNICDEENPVILRIDNNDRFSDESGNYIFIRIGKEGGRFYAVVIDEADKEIDERRYFEAEIKFGRDEETSRLTVTIDYSKTPIQTSIEAGPVISEENTVIFFDDIENVINVYRPVRGSMIDRRALSAEKITEHIVSGKTKSVYHNEAVVTDLKDEAQKIIYDVYEIPGIGYVITAGDGGLFLMIRLAIHGNAYRSAEQAISVIETSIEETRRKYVAMRSIISGGLGRGQLNMLFACSSNAIRSPTMHLIAEDFVKKHGLQAVINIASRGTCPWEMYERARLFAVNVAILRDLIERGIDEELVRRFRPNQEGMSKDAVDKADIIIVAGEYHRKEIIDRFPQAANKVFLLNEALPLAHIHYGEGVPDGADHFDEMAEALRGHLLPLLIGPGKPAEQDMAVNDRVPAFESAVDAALDRCYGEDAVKHKEYGLSEAFILSKGLEGICREFMPNSEFDFRDCDDVFSNFNKFYRRYCADGTAARRAIFRLKAIYDKYEPLRLEANRRIAGRGIACESLNKIVFTMEGEAPMRNDYDSLEHERRLALNVEYLSDEENDIFGVADITHEAGHGLHQILPSHLEEANEVAANWVVARVSAPAEIAAFLDNQLRVRLRIATIQDGRPHIYHHSAAHLLAFARRMGLTDSSPIVQELRRHAPASLTEEYGRYFDSYRPAPTVRIAQSPDTKPGEQDMAAKKQDAHPSADETKEKTRIIEKLFSEIDKEIWAERPDKYIGKNNAIQYARSYEELGVSVIEGLAAKGLMRRGKRFGDIGAGTGMMLALAVALTDVDEAVGIEPDDYLRAKGQKAIDRLHDLGVIDKARIRWVPRRWEEATDILKELDAVYLYSSLKPIIGWTAPEWVIYGNDVRRYMRPDAYLRDISSLQSGWGNMEGAAVFRQSTLSRQKSAAKPGEQDMAVKNEPGESLTRPAEGAVTLRKEDKALVVPRHILDSLRDMTRLARKLNIELHATLYVKSGMVVSCRYPDDETKFAVIKSRSNDERTVTETTDYYERPVRILQMLKMYFEDLDKFREPGKEAGMEKCQAEIQKYMGRLEKALQDSDISLYSVRDGQRYRLNRERLAHMDRLAEDIKNAEWTVTGWISPMPIGNGYGASDEERRMEKIPVHNHPNGNPSPPSAIDEKARFGDIYSPRFFSGEMSALILDTKMGDELFFLYESDDTSKSRYQDMYNWYWYRNGRPVPGEDANVWKASEQTYGRSVNEERVLNELRGLAMVPGEGPIMLSGQGVRLPLPKPAEQDMAAFGKGSGRHPERSRRMAARRTGNAAVSQSVNELVDTVKIAAHKESLKEAKEEKRNILVAMEIADDAKHNPMPLANALQQVTETLKRRGVLGGDNAKTVEVKVVWAKTGDLYDKIMTENGEFGAPLSNIVVLGQEKTLMGKSFDGLRGKAFFACTDFSKPLDYVKLLTIAMKLAFGLDESASLAAKYGDMEIDIRNIANRIVRLLPKTEPIDTNEPDRTFRLQIRELKKHA